MLYRIDASLHGAHVAPTHHTLLRVTLLSEDEQVAALKHTYPMFSKPMTHTQFLTELGA